MAEFVVDIPDRILEFIAAIKTGHTDTIGHLLLGTTGFDRRSAAADSSHILGCNSSSDRISTIDLLLPGTTDLDRSTVDSDHTTTVATIKVELTVQLRPSYSSNNQIPDHQLVRLAHTTQLLFVHLRLLNSLGC